jgi:hypothetical protein
VISNHARFKEALQGIEDHRAARGKRYPLWLMLLIVVLGTMSECYGIQALEEFCLRHYQALCEHLASTVRIPAPSALAAIFGMNHGQELRRQWGILVAEHKALIVLR